MPKTKTIVPFLNIHLDVLAASFMINILGLTVPIVMLHVYDRILGNNSVSTALLLFSAAFIAVVIDGLFRYLRALVLQIYSEAYALDAPILLADKIMTSSKEYSPIRVRTFFDKLNILKNNYSGQSIVALLDLPFVFFYLYILWFLAGDVALVPGVLFIIAIISSLTLSRYAKRISLTKESNEQNLQARLYGFFFHLDSKKKNNLVAIEEAQLNNILSDHISNTTRQAALQSHLSSIIQVLSQLSTISVISFGAYKVIQGELTTGALAACSILAGRCIAPVGALLNTGVRLQENALAKEELSHFENQDFKEFFQIQTISIHSTPCIEGVYLLDNLDDFDLKYNNHRISEPDFIKIDGHCPLFSGTIIENLTAFKKIYASEALDYAGQLGLHEYFNKLPKGYEDPVNNDRFDFYDKSTKIQIALIRALISNKKFILIEDILSSFDPASRWRFISFIHSLDDFMILVKDPLMLTKNEFLLEEKKQAEARSAQKAALMAAMEVANA
ncbi:hypothetical protein PQO03_11740 [Lentisphaera profundi]|uniref:ABC transmembrane type-1 domain-containing protein n=1 Tax=Lentisphaera profundi TaxID=1658616 RepID=A0ABY7W0K4_9BACT|nr:hypothetical protein [Lentisphaera profundi]WDE98514.1 hypothetical protein PQO03_11740 [Lentisphaera profundi]